MRNKLNVAFVLIDAALGVAGAKFLDDIVDRELEPDYVALDTNYAIVRSIEDF